jgi:hypothetical protein
MQTSSRQSLVRLSALRQVGTSTRSQARQLFRKEGLFGTREGSSPIKKASQSRGSLTKQISRDVDSIAVRVAQHLTQESITSLAVTL